MVMMSGVREAPKRSEKLPPIKRISSSSSTLMMYTLLSTCSLLVLLARFAIAIASDDNSFLRGLSYSGSFPKITGRRSRKTPRCVSRSPPSLSLAQTAVREQTELRRRGVGECEIDDRVAPLVCVTMAVRYRSPLKAWVSRERKTRPGAYRE